MAITLFHTLFNVGNTVLLAWFIPQILWLVDRMVPEAKEGTGKERKDEYHLTYISGGTVSTAELNLQSAKKELQLFSKEVLKMYALLPGLRTANSEKAFEANIPVRRTYRPYGPRNHRLPHCCGQRRTEPARLDTREFDAAHQRQP